MDTTTASQPLVAASATETNGQSKESSDRSRRATTTPITTTTTITTTRFMTSAGAANDTTGDSEHASFSRDRSFGTTAAAPASRHCDSNDDNTTDNTTSNKTSDGGDCTSGSSNPTTPDIPSDDYGLPVLSEDPVRSKKHAAVVSRLPPRSSFLSSSSEKGAGSSGCEGAKSPNKTRPALMFELGGGTSGQTGGDDFPRKRKKKERRSKHTSEPKASASKEDNSCGSGTHSGHADEESPSAKPSSYSSPSASFGEDRGYKRKRSAIDSPDLGPSGSGILEESSSAESSCDEVLPHNLVGLKMAIATRRKHQAPSVLQTNCESAMYRKGVAAMRKKRRTDAATGGGGLKSTGMSIPAPMRMVNKKEESIDISRSPIFCLSTDVMAHCLTFLEPLEVHELLSMPLSKAWRSTFAMPQELWRVLCLMEPFKAMVDIDAHDGDENSDSLLSNGKHLLGSYRLLYTSFVLCIQYLARIKNDAMNGRPPSVQGYGIGEVSPLRTNVNLKSVLARARAIISKNKKMNLENKSGSEGLDEHIGVTDENSSVESIPNAAASSQHEKAKKPTYGHSQLTQRLLGPSKNGHAGNVNLPWSCAIYSIVNWMVAFADVEGIQTMCLKVLPYLLEDESQRTTAQRAGLTDVVLRSLVLFSHNVQLHTAAFHTIVLLARPLGGREGVKFHCSMVNSSGIFNDETKAGKNGIAVMLDSMRRFEHDEVLQAMSCWSLVNIALAPSQKAVLVKLGGISVVANAMMQHPYNAEVQFRALFALINLVIPAVHLAEGDNSNVNALVSETLGEVDTITEKDMLDESVTQIANLVVLAMKNFSASKSILNRACLVLHNLSLTEDYHTTLLWTPNGYKMLEWCLANYRTDKLLQRSAAGTLHRLQTTLSNNADLRQRFTSSIQSQQQKSLDRAHEEAQQMTNQQRLLQEEQRITTNP